jgi:hypothetical protein
VLGGVAYWEGACRVLDDQAREIGSAYLELTGYVGNLTERFHSIRHESARVHRLPRGRRHGKFGRFRK